jgi:hypothetical protein
MVLKDAPAAQRQFATRYKQALIRALQRVFVQLNPGAATDLINWNEHVDSSLTLSENLQILERDYPQYRWIKSKNAGAHRPVSRPAPVERHWIDGTAELRGMFRHVYWRIKIPDPSSKMFGTVYARGFDTETDSRGDLIVLADDREYLIYPDIHERLEFLLKSPSNDAEPWLGFFFNLDFDFASIVKPIVENIEFNPMTGRAFIKYDGFTISYIPHKTFSISAPRSKRTAHFYDVSNFLSGTLDSLARKYLGLSKNDIDLGITDKGRMEQYDPHVIGRYCVNDALLTRQLAEWLINTTESFAERFIGVKCSPAKFTSKAALAEFYAWHSIPADLLRPSIPMPVMDIAYSAYHGGLFDLHARGRARVAILDINSAYPSVMRDLMPIRGHWRRVRGYDPDADYGFYRVHARYNEYMPFTVHGKVYYPRTNSKYPYVATQSEMREWLADAGADVVDGWVLHVDPSYRDARPLKAFIDALYQMKLNAKREGDTTTYWLSKVIMNSLYGKFAQYAGGLPGSLFNPVWAAEITARTRIKLYHMAREIGENRVISFDTDSISFIPDGVDFNRLRPYLDGEELGKWDFKVKPDDAQELIYVQNGVVLSGDLKEFYHTRGFQKTTLRKFELAPDGIRVRYMRPVHLREALRRKDTASINRFMEFEKLIVYESDKRIWARNFYDAGFHELIPGAPKGDSWVRSVIET